MAMEVYIRNVCGRAGFLSWCVLDIIAHLIWIKLVATRFGPSGYDVLWREGFVACSAVKQGEVLLAYGVSTATIQVLDLFTICTFEGTKNSENARLELVRNMGRKSAQNDVVLETKLQDLFGFVCSEAVVDEHARSTIGLSSGGGIEDMLNPVQTDRLIGASTFRAGKVPSGGGMGGPIAAVG